MRCLASYPIAADAVQPHIGKTVIGMTHGGDLFCARIDRIENGNVYFTCDGPSPQVSGKLSSDPVIRGMKRKLKKKGSRAQTKAYSPYYGYYGFGTGLSFFIPLILLAALFAWW